MHRSPARSSLPALLPVVLLALVLPLLGLAAAPATAATTARAGTSEPAPVEDYADYVGQKKCAPKPKRGTRTLQAWAVGRFGGTAGGISRACKSGGASEHKEGRAFDWTLDAAKAADRKVARKMLRELFATGPSGEAHELARRMGVMYIIWDDTMYASYRQFEATPYVSSSCEGKPLRRCSKTLRHRDHVHVSLSWRGARGNTSWYDTPAARKYS